MTRARNFARLIAERSRISSSRTLKDLLRRPFGREKGAVALFLGRARTKALRPLFLLCGRRFAGQFDVVVDLLHVVAIVEHA
jgi:hypothetical protein